MTNLNFASYPFGSDLAWRIRRLRVPAVFIGPTVGFVDIVVIFAAMQVSAYCYSGIYFNFSQYFALSLVSAMGFIVCSRFWPLYRYSYILSPRGIFGYLGLSVAFSVCVVTFLLFLLKMDGVVSRRVLLTFGLLAPPTICGGRLAISSILRYAIGATLIVGRRVVIVGERDELDAVSIENIFDLGVAEIGRVELSSGGEEILAEADRAQVMQAIDLARIGRASEYALIVNWGSDRRIHHIAEILRSSPRAIRLYPDRKMRTILSRDHIGSRNACFYAEIQPEPLSYTDRCVKRVFDIALASFGVFALLPVFAVAAILVKLDAPGPVFFRQKRKGFDDIEFRIWKFRTMRVMEDGPTVRQAQRNDCRVTKIGRILRRTSIDEIPQLINVLRGEMSIVGPRPHAVAHDQEYDNLIAKYAWRRHVKPGLTGLAQVSGLRGETHDPKRMEMRVEKDLWYINNWSFWLDARIILRTVISLALNEAF